MIDGQAVPSQLGENGIVLRPSFGVPLGSVFLAVFVGLIGVAALSGGGLSAWWAFTPAFALSGLAIWSVARVLRNRRLLALEVTPYSQSMGRAASPE